MTTGGAADRDGFQNMSRMRNTVRDKWEQRCRNISELCKSSRELRMWKLHSGISVGKEVGAKSFNEELQMEHGNRCLGSVCSISASGNCFLPRFEE
jgi:hypothetical protein